MSLFTNLQLLAGRSNEYSSDTFIYTLFMFRKFSLGVLDIWFSRICHITIKIFWNLEIVR